MGRMGRNAMVYAMSVSYVFTMNWLGDLAFQKIAAPPNFLI
jgi:hypothetical protein